jgi:hypothetical protein
MVEGGWNCLRIMVDLGFTSFEPLCSAARVNFCE